MRFPFSLIILAAISSYAPIFPIKEVSVVKDVITSNELFVDACPENPDRLYNRQKLLEQFDEILKTSVPEYVKYQTLAEGFFIYDLTEPSNKYKSPTYYAPSEGCINFINNHVYYFSVIYFPFSRSQIAILENGKLKVFNSINCRHSKDKLEDVISYVSKELKDDKNKDETVTRLKNYRRYGFYRTTDELKVACNDEEQIAKNSDKLYDRWRVLEQLSAVLRSSAPELIRKYYSPFFVEESRANGFFIYDLTDPSNRQTSKVERVEFKNRHAYHFAFIDLPFSFSHIVILEDGRLKVFRALNCIGKGDSLKDVIDYLSQHLKNDKNKYETINRVKNYTDYGVYASFNGFSTPLCDEYVSTANNGLTSLLHSSKF